MSDTLDSFRETEQEINRLKLEIEALKKRAEEAEGELTIIKGIGNNSPEMLALKKENNELAKMNDIIREEAQVIQLQADNEVRKFTKRIANLEDVNKSHQKLNGELRELLRETVQKLADQKDLVKTYRKAGIL
tara:strand:- start:752 stop:1150 length:399 start_codon:yes stop_codon:yes gene_type:complete